MLTSLIMRVAALAALILAADAQAQAPATVPAQTPHPELSAPAQAHLQTLQQAARQQGLAASSMWRTLLHYRVQPITRMDRSLADDPDFFLAPQGQHDGQAELDATLAAFFDPSPRHALNQSAACRFIARYKWLDAQLHFDQRVLPPLNCERYQHWRDGVNAETATLIFPSAFLNSPASMYGHTFLRLDPPHVAGRTNTALLSYGVNYSATSTGAENGVAFALKGLVGLTPGQFTNAPYYLRIREYNDLENRDIWEYELNLTREDIDRLLDHTWELGPTRFDYYFFDENCSYHLLSLLDAARPELGLSEQFTWWAIPLDTVRAVAQVPGLLKAIRYRPSNATELRYRADLLGPAKAYLAQQLSQGELQPAALPALEPAPEQRALILETAERLVAFDATRKASTEEATQRQRMALLSARASLPAGPALVVPTPMVDPTQGHDTGRIDLMLGQRNGHGAVTLQARPAYHELMDPERGYQRGAAIQFFSAELSKDANEHLQLERFTPVAITSIAAREPLLSARSWRVSFGLQRSAEADANRHRPMGAMLRGGPGLAFELAEHERLLGYAFVDNHAAWDRSLTRRPWAFGSGLAAGLLGDVSPAWRLQVEAYGRLYIGAQPHEIGSFVQSRYSLSKQWNFNAKCEVSKREDTRVNQACWLGVQRYL